MTLQINPVLDINYLNQVYGDDANIIHLIFDAFLSDSMPRWHSLKTALDEENLKESASIVHGLKPSFTMAGLTAIRPKVDQLEKDIKAKAEIDKLKQAYLHISEELIPLIAVIESESKRLSAL
ncbi:Hpt domain-containing protein [Dyadobacter luteus]|uniref:Hpt domain-containing protein n=1 Tax=Dyadobacter luteus TaxID=2259619 RepID=A0A3D8Y4J6_9BACT|nr:Hpt domain-containing protein [Dyadobacter luteus]REA57048.1 Hpt domain-containing protein [Dyadobacter luteus]